MVALADCPNKELIKKLSKEQRIAHKHLSDRWWRLNNLYWITDDDGNKIKFKVNPIQENLYKLMWWLNIILKSRQHGITTFICIFFLDACLFNSNVRAGIIAHKLTDAQRIFKDKIKFAYDNLPKMIKRAIPTTKDDAGQLMLANNSSIYVGTSMRSGTLQYLHISEYGYVCAHAAGKAKEIKTGATETVHKGGIIFIESTAEGMGNDFHLICETARKHQGEMTRLDYKFFFFPWYKKPENTLPPESVVISNELKEYFEKIEAVTGDKIDEAHRAWYFKKKVSLRSDIYKEHPSTAEEAFIASLEGAYLGHEMVKAKEEGRIGNYPWERQARVFAFWDNGSIHTAIWFCQLIQGRLRLIDFYYDNTGQGMTRHAKMLQDKPYVYAEHWCGWDLDPDFGSNRKNPTSGRYIKDEAADLGIDLKILPKYAFNDRIQAMRDVISKCEFNQGTCDVGITALYNYRKSINQAMSTEERIVFNKDPAPGPECHIADAFGHGAMAYRYHIVVNHQRIGYPQPLPASAGMRSKRRDKLGAYRA